MLDYLRAGYPTQLSDDHPCEFRLLSSGELASPGEMNTTVSLYLYRIIINEHLRSSRPRSTPSGTPALSKRRP